MHKQIIIRDRQEFDPDDWNRTEQFVQDTLDHLVRDAITDDLKYAGFDVAQTSSVEITVAPGRLHADGEVYVNETLETFNLLSLLPVANKRVVAIVAYATTIETDVQERDFLVDVDSEQMEPAAVPMVRQRKANVDRVAGVAGADPQPPTTGAENLAVCLVTLGTAGILSIEMVAANRLESLEAVGTRVGALEVWRGQAGTRLETLASDLAGLAGQGQDVAHANVLEAIMFDVARIRRAVELPDVYAAYGADLLLTEERADTDTVGYAARIEEGLTFPLAAQDVGLVSLFNPFDAGVKVYGNGLMLPAHSSELRVAVPGYSGAVSLTQYQVQTWALVKKHTTRKRTRWGNRWKDTRSVTKLRVLRRSTPGPNGEPVGSEYPVAPILFNKAAADEDLSGWRAEQSVRSRGQVRHIRGRHYRLDRWTEPYWTQIATEVSVDGALRAQSFLNAQDGWLTRVGLYFTTLAATGDVRVMLTELTEAGTPDMAAVVADVTLARADMALYPLETTVEIGPAFLRAGRRYAIVLLSQAAHSVALGDPLAYSGGASFYSVDGAFFTGSQTDDLKFNLYYAKFARTWLQVQLDPLSLGGGISEIDLIEEGWTPESTSAVYEVQASGQPWVPLAELPDSAVNGPLHLLPTLLNFRVTLSGTPDVMPGINLAATQQHLQRPATAMTFVSDAWTLAAASQTIKVKVVSADFVEADHDLTISLLAGPGETAEAADAVETETLADGTTVRTATFNFAAPGYSQFKVKLVGATAGATSVFTIDEYSWIAL